MKALLFLWAALAPTGQAASELAVLAEQRYPDAIERFTSMEGQPDLTWDAARRLALAFASDHAKERIAILRIFSRKEDFQCFGMGVGGFHGGYDQWARRFSSCRFGPKPMSETVVFAGATVLRYLDSSGQVHREVLHGEDPFTIELKDQTAEVVYVRLRRDPPVRKGGQVGWMLTLFVRTSGRPGRPVGSEILNALKGISGLSVSMNLRADAWFVGDVAFPIVFPFEQRWQPPSRDVHLSLPSVSCLRLRNERRATCLESPGKRGLTGTAR